ncbi:MAG: hypothetical protein R3F53_20665 [Gammaproteobacteria bacterium]
MKPVTLAPTLAALALGVMTTTAVAATSFIANSFYDQQHPHSRFGYIEWAELVKELSNGDLQPEVYTGTVLLAPRASLQGIRDNIAQVAHHPAVYTPSELPVANAVQELGFNFDDPLTGVLAVTDFSLNNPLQLKEWEDVGIVYLGAYNTTPYVLFCREPVRTLDELRGKRIRTAGSTVFANGWKKQAVSPSMCLPAGVYLAASIVARWIALPAHPRSIQPFLVRKWQNTPPCCPPACTVRPALGL